MLLPSRVNSERVPHRATAPLPPPVVVAEHTPHAKELRFHRVYLRSHLEILYLNFLDESHEIF